MKNKQTAKKTSVDANKLDDLLTMVHSNHHSLKDELERMKHNYQDAVKQIAILEDENDKIKEETSYEKYCVQQIEKTGEAPTIVDYIKFLEFRHDEEQETLSRAEERYKTLMKTLKENRELKKQNKDSSNMIGELRHYEDFVYSSVGTEDEFKEFLESEGFHLCDNGDIVEKPESSDEESD